MNASTRVALVLVGSHFLGEVWVTGIALEIDAPLSDDVRVSWRAPVWQMCRSGITSVSHFGKICRRNALKVAPPELPASGDLPVLHRYVECSAPGPARDRKPYHPPAATFRSKTYMGEPPPAGGPESTPRRDPFKPAASSALKLPKGTEPVKRQRVADVESQPGDIHRR
jgi:hypothetical protein